MKYYLFVPLIIIGCDGNHQYSNITFEELDEHKAKVQCVLKFSYETSNERLGKTIDSVSLKLTEGAFSAGKDALQVEIPLTKAFVPSYYDCKKTEKLFFKIVDKVDIQGLQYSSWDQYYLSLTSSTLRRQ